MLHWPDSMATYMTGDNILFSNDAFGQHYALEELFNDKADTCTLWEEAIKYYANILNPYSPLVKRRSKRSRLSIFPLISSPQAMASSGGITRCRSWRNTMNGLRNIRKIRLP